MCNIYKLSIFAEHLWNGNTKYTKGKRKTKTKSKSAIKPYLLR